jgi:hypothetical protein
LLTGPSVAADHGGMDAQVAGTAAKLAEGIIRIVD